MRLISLFLPLLYCFYSGKFSESVLNQLRASPHVEYIEKDVQLLFEGAADDDDDDSSDSDDSSEDSIVNLPWTEYPTQYVLRHIHAPFEV